MKQHMKKIVLAAGLVVLALAALALATSGRTGVATAQEPVNQGQLRNVISAPGTGTASGTPDVALVELGVQTVDADIGAALEEANQTIDEVIAALGEAGIPAEDIQTVRFDVQTLQDVSPQTGEPIGQPRFQVTNIVRVRIADTDTVSDVLQAALEAGANQVFNLQFTLSDPDALAAEARAAAVADARQSAEELAEALGVELGDVVIMTEQSFGPQPLFAAEAGLAQGDAAGPTIEQGQLTVTIQVQGVWEIQQ